MSSETRLELSACPFCGDGEPDVICAALCSLPYHPTQSKTAHTEVCQHCGARGPLKDTPEEARAAWDRRAPLGEPDAGDGGALIHGTDCSGQERETSLCGILLPADRDGGLISCPECLQRIFQQHREEREALRAEAGRLREALDAMDAMAERRFAALAPPLDAAPSKEGAADGT